jgi:hypothetical protein
MSPPEQMVSRLAAEIARRSGQDDSVIFRETAKQYLRVAMGYSPISNVGDDITFNSTTSEIKGLDGNWYEVPEQVLRRYMLIVGFAGANLSDYKDLHLSNDQLVKLCGILYPFYKSLDSSNQEVLSEGLRSAIQEAASSA